MTGRAKIHENICHLMISKNRSMRRIHQVGSAKGTVQALKKMIYCISGNVDGIKFGNLAPNRAFINIGEILIWWPAQPNQQRLPGVKNIGRI